MTRLAAVILLASAVALAACSHKNDSSTIAPALTHNVTGTAPAESCDQCGVVTKVSKLPGSNAPSGDTIKSPSTASDAQPQAPAYSYQVVAHLNSGRTVTVTYSTDPGLTVGDKVEYVNGYLAKEQPETKHAAKAGPKHSNRTQPRASGT